MATAISGEIDTYITNIRTAITEYGKALSLKQQLGNTNILCDKMKLMLLSGYLDCISDYFIEDDYENNNFFTNAEIRDIMQYINNICRTNYILVNL